jgi:hypothetical protein
LYDEALHCRLCLWDAGYTEAEVRVAVLARCDTPATRNHWAKLKKPDSILTCEEKTMEVLQGVRTALVGLLKEVRTVYPRFRPLTDLVSLPFFPLQRVSEPGQVGTAHSRPV